jgi:DNA-binding transcriptional MerR regulator
MKDLVAASGLPRTTIHYYLRVGVLPPPLKTSANSARYSEEHIERLDLIRALRSTELGPFSIEHVQEILRMVDEGVDPLVASVTLTSGLRTGHEDLVPQGGSAADLAAAAEVPETTIDALVAAGLLIEAPGGRFDAPDVLAARSYRRILELTGLHAEDLAPIGDLLHELARYEDTISRVAASRSSGAEGVAREQNLERMFQSVHRYLIIRHRSAGPSET